MFSLAGNVKLESMGVASLRFLSGFNCSVEVVLRMCMRSFVRTCACPRPARNRSLTSAPHICLRR